MADHPPTVPRRAVQSNARPDRLGEYHPGRSPPGAALLDEGAAAPNAIATSDWNIWGAQPLGAALQGHDDPYLSQRSAPLEQQPAATSIMSSEAWNPIGARGWAGEASASASVAQPGEGLPRQSARLRGNQYESPKNPNEAPRSSSPYFTPRQGYPQMGKPATNGVNFNEGNAARGLGQQMGSNRFTPGTDGTYPHYQNLANHQYNAPQHVAAHTQQFAPSFGNSRQQYSDLGRETREAERLAVQFRQLGVNPDEQDSFAASSRNAYPTFAQTQINNPLPTTFSSQSQPQYVDYQGYQSRQTLPGGVPLWGGHEEASFSGETYGGENTYAEGNQASQIYPHGDSSQRSVEPQTQARIGTTGSGQVQLRDQSFPRPPYSLPYQYPPFNNIRLPSETQYHAAPIGALIPQANVARQEDFTHNLRSVLLEEFRSNSKSNKRYELKDIYTHVVEFSGDQHGSRFIQQKLETANSDEKDTVFNEIHPNCLQLMTDVFGNYVIQKFFEHGSQLQKSILAKQMEGHVLTLSLQMYGCRVVQKALEHILVDQQAALVKELDGHVLKCVKDQNGNHVVQKAIERVPAEHIQFIINAFTKQVHNLATHPYGCRVIQRMLEHCDAKAQAAILDELHQCTYTLVQDQYGNYVTQHIIEKGKTEDRGKIIQLVTTQLLHFSKHKFASNVVEKSIQFGSDEQRRDIVRVITTPRPDGSSPLQVLMRDQFGNYVIQKLLMQLNGRDRDVLVDQIKPQLQALKKFTHGKQISAIEKLIYNSSTPPGSQSATPPPTNSATPSSSSTIAPPPKSAPHARKSSSIASTALKATSKEFNGSSADSKNTKGPGKTDGAPL